MEKLFAFLLIATIGQSVLADMTCNTDISDYYLLYEIDSYTCDTGYYLPANTNECKQCPNGFICSGGTFEFNPDIFQGLSIDTVPNTTISNICAANFPTNLYVEYEPNSHNCLAGTYLPANIDECTQCPENSYCVAGTYSFNETTDQGITACPNGYHSSVGASSASDCVPNVITINWSGADAEDITANNAGTCTYDGDIRTPVKAIHIPGKTFVGWIFDVAE